MANPEHLEVLKQGVEHWNQWRKEHPDVLPDLSDAILQRAKLGGANLSRADVRRVDLREADLSRTNLSAARLRRTILYRADLSGADLSEANVTKANLIGANLHQANLGAADLSGALLSWAILKGANLDGANLGGTSLREASLVEARLRNTIFADVDLSAVKGLDTVVHEGPSTIGIDTIFKSRGKISEVFLRGCGVPDAFISYIGSIVGRPVEFYSCFISYSTKDQQFAERLCNDLQANGARCWLAPHDVTGRNGHEPIDDAIRLHDKLLLILSEHSMNSDWVKAEIANAREREEHEKRQMLFPITLVPQENIRQRELFGTDSAREIREYLMDDFSNWKDHDSYQRAFQQLLKDLKAERPSDSPEECMPPFEADIELDTESSQLAASL
ncbi:MAG: toll/interleukin-1 receptor domain-containing protein [Candidatus Korobacteraceae bacterium]